MFKHIAYGGVVVAAAVALGGLGVGGAGASATASRAGQPAGHTAAAAGTAGAVPGTQLWAERYDGPGHGYDIAYSVAVSPRGDKVFVTGRSPGVAEYDADDYATVAYNAATGAQVWAKRYNGPVNRGDGAKSVAVSPGGDLVFVTGNSASRHTGRDFATVAYNAATGAQVWAKRYNGPANRADYATSVAVSPRGDKVFVTGNSAGGPATSVDYATVAYNAATGAQVWAKRYTLPGYYNDYAKSVAVSPRGDKVFVTGTSNGGPTWRDYATVAYNAATGAQVWAKRYNGPGNNDDRANSVAVSPAGGTVYVTGDSWGLSAFDYATVAYNAATGAQVWVKRYNGPGNNDDRANSVAVSPAGGTVYVTGDSWGLSAFDYATVAYNAATGAQVWVKRYNGPGNAKSVAVSPRGDKVFVTGNSLGVASDDYTTVAYNAATGAQVWVQRYDGPGNSYDWAAAVAVSPSGDRVFVTGVSDAGSSSVDYATVAYNAATGAQVWVKRYDGPANSGSWAEAVAVSPSGGRVFVTGASSGGASGDDYATVAYSG
jgi:WD40 repeat protein